MKPATLSLPNTAVDPRFPGYDRRPLGETDFHNNAQTALRVALRRFFRGQSVYVTSNLVMYWDPEQPRLHRDPDILVIKGVGTHARRTMKLWEEDHLPCTIFEIVSRKTWKTDLVVKPQEYASMGIREYFLFEPEQENLDPPLQGFRTVKGRAVAMKPAADGSLVSKQLGLRLAVEGELLGLYDLKSGARLLTPDEAEDQERQRAEQQKEQTQLERQRVREEQQRAQQQQQLAEQERLRAEQLAAEVERLRELLRQQQGQQPNGSH